jgi:hypothetical protein
MMDIFFQDPAVIPLPPQEVRIREVSVKPYPDGRRVRVHIELDPFQKCPSLEIVILDEMDMPVAQTRVIDTIGRTLEMTMHLRTSQPGSTYKVWASLYYQEDLQAGMDEPLTEGPVMLVVDRRQASFVFPL